MTVTRVTNHPEMKTKTRAAGSGSHYTLCLMRGEEPDTSVRLALPSVTTILNVLGKPALVPWAYRQTLAALPLLAEKGIPLEGVTSEELDGFLREYRLRPFDKRDDAATRGTDVHSYLEALAMGHPREPENGYERAVLDWWHSEWREVVGCEEFVCSMRYGFAGTADLLWRNEEDELVLTDLKTSKAIYPEARLQVAAYAGAWEEMRHEIVWRTTVICAHEDGTWTEETTDAPFETFLQALEVWKWMNPAS